MLTRSYQPITTKRMLLLVVLAVLIAATFMIAVAGPGLAEIAVEGPSFTTPGLQ